MTDRQREGHEELPQKSFLDVIQQNRSVLFYVEIGNEPDVYSNTIQRPTFDHDCDGDFDSADAAAYRDRVVSIAYDLRRWYPEPNLKWATNMPTKAWMTDIVLDGDSIETEFDAISNHIYANGQFVTGNCVQNQDAEWGAFCDHKANLDIALSKTSNTDTDILITEMGIAGNDLDSDGEQFDKDIKGQRYDEYIRNGLDDERIIAVLPWVIGRFHDAMCNCDGSQDANGDPIVGDSIYDYGYVIESAANGHQGQAEILGNRFAQGDYVQHATGYYLRGEFYTTYRRVDFPRFDGHLRSRG